MSKKGDTAITQVRNLFAYDTVIMALLLGLISWGGTELVGANEAIAALSVESSMNRDKLQHIEGMGEALIRIEEGQGYLDKRVGELIEDIRVFHSR